jgi:hypothetical protein
MTPTSADEDRIKRIFFPHTELKTREVSAAGGRFVYYTTAETATCILRNKQIWMRNTAAMNDYLEVEHGFDCLNASYKAAPGNTFNAALNACFPGLADEVRDFFNGWLPSIHETRISHACLNICLEKTSMDAFQCGEPMAGRLVSRSFSMAR